MTNFKPLFILRFSTNEAPAKCEKRKGICTRKKKLVQPKCRSTNYIHRKQLALHMLLGLNAVWKEIVEIKKLPLDTEYTCSYHSL